MICGVKRSGCAALSNAMVALDAMKTLLHQTGDRICLTETGQGRRVKGRRAAGRRETARAPNRRVNPRMEAAKEKERHGDGNT